MSVCSSLVTNVVVCVLEPGSHHVRVHGKILHQKHKGWGENPQILAGTTTSQPAKKICCTPIPDLESFGLLSGQFSLQRQQKVQHANVSVLRLHDGHRLIS